MEKTIKEENEREVIAKHYLNDNAILEGQLLKEEKGYVKVVVRYISSMSIRESFLTKLSIPEFFQNFSDFIEINQEEDAIALFTKVEDGYQLEKIYNPKKHEFAISEFIDLVYAEKFPSSVKNLDKYLIKKPKTNS